MTKDLDAPETRPPPRAHRQSFADEARERIERAVRNGLIERDDGTGLAIVVHPEPPAQPSDAYSVEDFAALERHRAVVAEAADVAWLLEHPAAQLAALRALDVQLFEVARKDAIAAGELVRDLAILTAGHAPLAVLERAMPVIRREAHVPLYEDVEPWMEALPVIMLSLAVLCPDDASEERSRAELVLDILQVMVPDAPRPFLRRKPEHLRAADRFLASMRVATPGDAAPHSARRGPPLTPWRAASEFSRRFGVTNMPLHPKLNTR